MAKSDARDGAGGGLMSTGVVTKQREAMLQEAEAVRLQGSALWLWAALGAIALGSCGHLLIKLGVTAVPNAVAGSLFARIEHYLLQPAAITGLGIYGAGTLLWIYAVSQKNISFLYPLTALTYVIVALGGKFIFGEAIPAGRWLGIAVVMIGVALLQFSAKGEKQ